MSKIRKDEVGLYVHSGGYIARPFQKTNFKEGDSLKTHHFVATPFHGVGKNESCGHGQYVERWIAAGSVDKKLNVPEKKATFKFYKSLLNDYPGAEYPSVHINRVRNVHRRILERRSDEETRKIAGERLHLLNIN